MYSYHDRVSYSRIDKDGLLGVSDTVNAMQDLSLIHILHSFNLFDL